MELREEAKIMFLFQIDQIDRRYWIIVPLNYPYTAYILLWGIIVSVHSHSNYSLTSPSNIGIAVELMFNEYPTTAICKLSCESLPIPLESKNYPSSLPDNIVLTIRVLYAGMVYIFYLPIFWKSNVILCDLLLLLCPKIWQSCSKKFYLRNHLKLW